MLQLNHSRNIVAAKTGRPQRRLSPPSFLKAASRQSTKVQHFIVTKAPTFATLEI